MSMTPAEIKKRFEAEGQTLSDWAKQNGFERLAVYQVLNGQLKGKYGKAHEIAVKLGIKPAPQTNRAAR